MKKLSHEIFDIKKENFNSTDFLSNVHGQIQPVFLKMGIVDLLTHSLYTV